MIVNQSDIAKRIQQLRKIVPTRSTMPSIQSIYVNDGYLIGSNLEITIKAKLEGTEGERMLIPQKAFDLICNMPAGNMEITQNEKFEITIKSGRIKNKFSSNDPDTYSVGADKSETQTITCDYEELKTSISRVLFAIDPNSPQQMMKAMCMECKDGFLSFIGLDGHMIAWDKIKYQGDFKMLVPKSAAERLLALDMDGEVSISYSNTKAIFASEQYTVETRLFEGDFYKINQMFGDLPLETSVNRKLFMDAINRATLCSDTPEAVRFDFEGEQVRIYLNAMNSNYEEFVQLDKPISEKLTIGFNPKLLIPALKTVPDEDITINLSSPKHPMIVKSEESDFKALVLPVAIK